MLYVEYIVPLAALFFVCNVVSYYLRNRSRNLDEPISLRLKFSWLLVVLLLLGWIASLAIYRLVSSHNLNDWLTSCLLPLVFAVNGFLGFRYAQFIYRRLGN
jgi:hypothetical protein